MDVSYNQNIHKNETKKELFVKKYLERDSLRTYNSTTQQKFYQHNTTTVNVTMYLFYFWSIVYLSTELYPTSAPAIL